MDAIRQLSLPFRARGPAGSAPAGGSSRGAASGAAASEGVPSRDAVVREAPLPEAPSEPLRLPSITEARAKARALADELQHRLEADVRLAVTDNRSSLVTVRRERGAYLFRVHHMFLDADPATREALAHFGAGRRRKTAGRRLDDFIDRHRDRIRDDPAAGPRAPAPPQGRHHDLQAIFDRINAEYFGGRVVARIGWGENRGSGRRRRSIKMGSYVHDARLIRLHPALDRAEIPEIYVAWVVYHEMLHQVVPPIRRGGRTLFHPPEFRRRERDYRQSDEAKAWEDRNFELLLKG